MAEWRHAGMRRRGRRVVGLGWWRRKILDRICARLLVWRGGGHVGVLHRRRLVHGVHVNALGSYRVLERSG
ncbi:MAG: hypothetical protein ABGY24_09765 [bacterium]